jgi:hypothetical protein
MHADVLPDRSGAERIFPLARKSLKSGAQSMIPKKPAPDVIGGWEPVFGNDHAQRIE